MKCLLAEDNLQVEGNSPCCDVWEQENRRLWLRDVKSGFHRINSAETIFFLYSGSDGKHFHCQYCVARKKIEQSSMYAYTAFSVILKSSLSRMLLFILCYHIMPFNSASASVTFNCIKTFPPGWQSYRINHIFKRTSAFGYWRDWIVPKFHLLF